MKIFFKQCKAIVIWCVALCLLLPSAMPILAWADSDIPTIIVRDREFELSAAPYTNELGVMVDARDIIRAFEYGYRFDSENKSLEIFADGYGTVTLMHNATEFLRDDFKFECLPYFYVENGIPMIETGFFCEMFNSSYKYDGHNLITIDKDIPIADVSKNDDIFRPELMSADTDSCLVSGRVQLPADFEHSSNVNVQLVVTPCSGPTRVWESTYGGGGHYVTIIMRGQPADLGEIILRDGAKRSDFEYELPESIKTTDYPYYTLSYAVTKDDSHKLMRYGAYKDDSAIIELGSSPQKGAFSSDAHRYDITETRSESVIKIPLMGNNKPDTSSEYYGKNTAYHFSIRDYEKSGYYDENIFNISIGGEQWTTGKGGNVSATPESLYGDFTVEADGYMPMRLSTNYLKKYFYNRFTMYKTGYSKKPEIHAVYCGKTNVFNTGDKQVFYIGDTTEKTEIVPMINNNGKKIKSVKIVQGTTELPIKNLEYGNAMSAGGKSYQTAVGTTGKFTPGVKFGQKKEPIYIVVTTTFGEITKHKLNIEIAEKAANDVDMDLGDEVSFESPEADYNILGPMSLKYKLFDKAPFSLKLTPDGKGNYGIKGTIGLDCLESEQEDKTYKTVKDSFKAAARDTYISGKYNGKNAIQKFNDYFKKLGDANLVSSDRLPAAEMGIKCSLKMYGYVDGSYDLQPDNTYKISFSEGGISAKFEYNQDFTRQTVIPTAFGPAPVYWGLGWGFSDALTIPLVGEDGKLTIPESVDNEFEISVKGKAGAGVVDLATCGASGEGTLTISGTIPVSKDTLEVVLQGKINLLDFKLGILQGSVITLNSPKLMFYPKFQILPATEAAAAAEPQQLSRAYTDAELVFNVDDIQLMSLDDDETSIKTSTVAANTYTFSDPQLAETSDGKMILAWVEDERSRESDADRTAIYYSCYSNGAWSEPKIVFDDTTADFNPKLKSVNDKLYLTWANASENFDTNENNTARIAQTLVTSAAVWNGNGFDVLEPLNNKGALTSDIAEIDGVPTIVWTENTTGDLLQSGKNTALKSASLADGAWNVKTLSDNQAAIDGLCIAESNGSLCVYYSQDTDGDIATIADKEIFAFSNGKITQITDNETADTKPVSVNNVIYWYSGSKIAYKAADGEDIACIDAECPDDRFKISDNGGKKSIVFSSYNDKGEQTIAAVLNDGEGWGKPIEIAASGNYIGGYDSAYCSDGLLRVVSNDIVMKDDTLKEAAIDLYEVSDFNDIAIDNLRYDEYSVGGDKLWVYYDVTNNGTSAVEGLETTFYDENGSRYSYTNVMLLPGETITVSSPCSNHRGEKLKVRVLPWQSKGGTDARLDDNTAEISVYKSDVSIEGMTFEDAGDKTIISGFVFNRGTEDVSDVGVKLRKGTSAGEVIDTITTSAIKPGKFEYVEFELTEAEDGLYYMTCDELENENLIGNNSDFLKYSKAASVMKGDILTDGVINSKDTVRLAQYIAKWDITLTPEEMNAADIVADGVINSKDAVKLAQYLAKWDVTLE